MNRACVIKALSQSWVCAESLFRRWSFRFLTLAGQLPPREEIFVCFNNSERNILLCQVLSPKQQFAAWQ